MSEPNNPEMTDDETGRSATPKRRRPRLIALYLVIALILYAVLHAYSLLSPILLAFLLIILITLAINPIIVRMQKCTGGRKRATGLFFIGLLTLGALSVWASVSPLKQAGSTLMEKWPGYWERLQKPLIKMEQKSVITEEKLQQEVSEEIAQESPDTEGEVPAPAAVVQVKPDSLESTEAASTSVNEERTIRSSIGGVVQSTIGQVSGIAHNTTEILVVLATVFFGVIFTLLNPRPVFGSVFAVIPERHHDQALTVMMSIATFVPRWAGAMLISMFTIGLLVFLLMWPILGFADALVLGLIAGLLEAIPYLGPVLSAVPALLLALGKGGMAPVWVLIAYVVIQALESNVIMPMVMSRGMELHPVAVIFAMLLSIVAFGVLGVLIAAPMVAIVGIVHKELYRKNFLPSTTDEDLDRLARDALLEN